MQHLCSNAVSFVMISYGHLTLVTLLKAYQRRLQVFQLLISEYHLELHYLAFWIANFSDHSFPHHSPGRGASHRFTGVSSPTERKKARPKGEGGEEGNTGGFQTLQQLNVNVGVGVGIGSVF